jgi:hypothetical protein
MSNKQKRNSSDLASAERDVLEKRNRENVWRREFLDTPIPDAPAKLRSECQRLLRVLDDPTSKAHLIVAHSFEVVERLWRAMRLMGGVGMPQRPKLDNCTEAEAFADRLLGKERLESVQQTIDAVIDWCVCREADDPDQSGAGRGETKPRRNRGNPRRANPEDTKLFLHWKAAHDQTGITKEAFIRGRGLPMGKLAALERGRANHKRGSKSGRNSLD